MQTRRRVMGSLVAACAMPLCACTQDSGPRSAPTATRVEPPAVEPPAPTRLEAWEPVDAMFDGCVGG
jgi:hypothetical protein